MLCSTLAGPFLYLLYLLHLLADLLVTLRGDEHLDARLIHIIDVGPVGLDLRVFDAAGQGVYCPCRPSD